MKIKLHVYILSFFVLSSLSVFSQFSLGDIAFSAYNSDNSISPEDSFTIVLLRDVTLGESLGFTENGWLSIGGFRTGENSFTLTFGSNYGTGTQIVISRSPFQALDQDGNSAGTLSGSGLSLAVSGDQIFAYDPANVPSAGDETGFVAAIQMNGGWDSDASGTTSSAKPSVFTDGTNSISIDPEVDNARLSAANCSNFTDVVTLRTLLNTSSNWETDNANPYAQSPPLCDFSAGNTAPTASSFTASPGPVEDVVYTFATADFSYSDSDGDPLNNLLIEILPAVGTLYVDANNSDTFDTGEQLSMDSTVSKTDLDAGNLQYIQNGSTNTSFVFEVNDGIENSAGNYVATLNVTSCDAAFSYSASSYCVNDADPTPTISGDASGSFSATPTGLSLNSSSGLIDVSASTPNTYTITYTAPGGCSTNVSVTINALDDASFSYAASAYCVDASDPSPTITGLTGGTFSTTPGLSIASNGTIDVSASTPNTYTVTYTTNGTCPNSSTFDVTINALDDSSFSYSASAYCVDASDPIPLITGLTGGTFSATPSGLILDSMTGLINVNASTPNTYTVTYLTAGTCPDSSSESVTINALDDASFSYSASTYCVNGSDPSPTITGLTGGSFSSTPGLSIASNGTIDVSTSTPDTYTVTYLTAGTCPNSSTFDITINALDDAAFSYAASAYCVDASDPSPTITGLTGGTFSSTPGLSIASNGTIDVSASTPNTYTVTYLTAGTCPNSSTFDVTINALDDASFSYAASAYCVDAPDAPPTITGLTGGSFSSTPGLAISTVTGIIIPSASTPNTYTVTYTTNGTCPNSSTFDITINALDDASFSYATSAYCVDASDPSPTITGLTGGTFSSTPGLSIASNGTIDVSASTPNTYTVTYLTAGTCPNSDTFDVTINALDDASFSYAASAYCVDASDPSPTITGLTGGTFSSTPGLSIASNGTIDVSTSTPNTYTVTYLTAGTCPNSSTFDVTINGLDDASFSYSSASYSTSDPDPTPTITGLTGGTFSSTSGLSIASNGTIDLSASTPNTYTVTYTTAGTCPNSSSIQVAILESDTTSPTVDISSTESSPTAANPIPVTITFSEPIDNFDITDIVVGNGTADNLFPLITNTRYSVNINPTSSGIVTVDINANVSFDAAGNGNTAATQFSIQSDITRPSVVISSTESSPTSANPIPITITFSEDIIDFDLSDISVSNGTAGNLSGSGASFTAEITPATTGNSNITVIIDENRVSDPVFNGNTISNIFVIEFDSTLGIDDEILANGLTIYPIPSNNTITISGDTSLAIKRANIFDIQGKLVLSQKLNTNSNINTIDISSMGSGFYLMTIHSDTGSANKRIIKQ